MTRHDVLTLLPNQASVRLSAAIGRRAFLMRSIATGTAAVIVEDSATDSQHAPAGIRCEEDSCGSRLARP